MQAIADQHVQDTSSKLRDEHVRDMPGQIRQWKSIEANTETNIETKNSRPQGNELAGPREPFVPFPFQGISVLGALRNLGHGDAGDWTLTPQVTAHDCFCT
jgi:hypothetical protein